MSEFGLFLLYIVGGRTKSRLRFLSNGSAGEQVEVGARKVGATEVREVTFRRGSTGIGQVHWGSISRSEGGALKYCMR